MLNAQAGVDPAGDLFAEDYREESYWWSAAPPQAIGDREPFGPDSRADAVIIGGGITGLVAALKLARAGADVVVLDAEKIGEGAARRNAGFLGRTLKRSVDWLENQFGRDHAVRVYRELDSALCSVRTMVNDEAIDCHHTICGRIIAANSEAHLRTLSKELEDTRRAVGFDYSLIEKHEMHREIASDRYFGGALIPDLGSIHPGLYHAGLARKATDAGVRLRDCTMVMGVEGNGPKTVRTSRGSLVARHVVIATNGYTTKALPWFARRLIPFRGFMIATEALPPDTIAKVLPQRRTYLDTNFNIDFIRPAPDSNRLLFGGMTGTNCTAATPLGKALVGRLVRILPDLKGVRLSRAWTGYCAGTFDFMPHIGVREGTHYALGYNFAGLPLGTHFGEKLAARVLGRGDARSAFDVERFPTAPFYRGWPWFVPLAMRYFDWQDRSIAGS